MPSASPSITRRRIHAKRKAQIAAQAKTLLEASLIEQQLQAKTQLYSAQLRHSASLASLSSGSSQAPTGRRVQPAWEDDDRVQPGGRFFRQRAQTRFVEADLDDVE